MISFLTITALWYALIVKYIVVVNEKVLEIVLTIIPVRFLAQYATYLILSIIFSFLGLFLTFLIIEIVYKRIIKKKLVRRAFRKPLSSLAVIITALIVFFPIINFWLVPTLPNDEVVEKLSGENADDLAFLRAVYDDIDSRFSSESLCWKKNYFRNYLTSGIKIWELQGECLPCHVQNNVLKSYLVQSGRFEKEQIRVVPTFCEEAKIFHVYSEVTLKNGTKISVDQWGSEWDVIFGETIHDSPACNK